MSRRFTPLLLAFLCALQLVCLWRAPATFYPAAIALVLKPGQSATLGRAELAAAHGAERHLSVRRDRSGHWWASNVSAGKSVSLVRDGIPRRMGSIAPQPSQWFHVGARRFVISAANQHALAFTGAGHDWTYDGALLRRGGSVLPACPGTGIGTRALALWNRLAPRALSAARPLTFGGNLQCGNRLGVPGLAAASAQIWRTEGTLLLSNAGGSESQAPLMVSGAHDLAQREEALAGVTALTLGRTSMPLALQGDTLTLRPGARVMLFTEQRASLPQGVSWQWRQRGMWTLPGGRAWWGGAALCLLLAASLAASLLRGRWPFARNCGTGAALAAAGTALVAIAGLTAFLLQRSGAGLGAGVSMLVAWAALWTFLQATRRSLATSAAVLLMAAGLLVQLEMGLGATDASWLRHFQKTSALLAIGLGTGAHLALRLRHAPIAPGRTVLEWALASVAALALGALALQVVFGNETGVFDLQPVEFAKLALTALAAHCIAIGLGWQRAMPQAERALVRWLRLGAPALLFGALLALALLQVDDFSPLILLLVWGMAMTLAWSLAARKPAVAAALGLTAVLAAGAVAWMRLGAEAEPGAAGFYADRFAVWLDPVRHPHTGQQLLLAARAVGEGAWWGANNWLGLGALGQGASQVLAIPAVQDDFAPSFLIHRHGLIGALFLWALQAAFIGGLLHTAGRAWGASCAAHDFRQAWLWRFRCFVLCGGAAFVAGHLLLSWGTNLAIFPIMGQPMSFLSAGGSHLLFFICPLLAFHAVSAQSFEEKASCRSMSNTRSWARFTTYSMPKASGRRRDWRCSRAARYCATCWNALRASIAGAKRRAAFRT